MGSLSRSVDLRARLNQVVPGGAHTYAKGDDQYPDHLAPLLTRGLGSRVWDVDGNEYVEYGNGMRAVTLGHAHPAVLQAVRDQLPHGSNFARPTELELETAEDFLRLVPAADMVKFAKNGSDATTAAVRLARAATGRDVVAVCADQPFFSTDDWFIATTAMDAGIPAAVAALTDSFRYNDLDSVRALFARHDDGVAALVLEAASVSCVPEPGFLEGLRELCTAHGTLLVLDEMITGFRYADGGAQQLYDVRPDLSCFGKALGNGFAVSALAGRRDLMELGGFPDGGRRRVFLLSTTHGAEGHSLAAARAVMATYREEPVVETMWRQGALLAEGVRAAVHERGLDEVVTLSGPPCNMVYGTRDADGHPSQPFRTLFLQELLRRGVIAPSFVISAAHTDADVALTVDAVAGALDTYARGLADGIDTVLESRPVKPTFRART
jgi:glutamate-1-semialdehyde 2,1-aminomutase